MLVKHFAGSVADLRGNGRIFFGDMDVAPCGVPIAFFNSSANPAYVTCRECLEFLDPLLIIQRWGKKDFSHEKNLD